METAYFISVVFAIAYGEFQRVRGYKTGYRTGFLAVLRFAKENGHITNPEGLFAKIVGEVPSTGERSWVVPPDDDEENR